jgi:hypothetical protein
LPLLGVANVWRTSQNAVNANFGEYPYYDVG